MVGFFIDKLHDPKFMASLLAAIAAMATVITLAMPLIARDQLNSRLKAVGSERERIRQRERERSRAWREGLAAASPRQYMKSVVDQFDLDQWVRQEDTSASTSRGPSRYTRRTSRSCSSGW